MGERSEVAIVFCDLVDSTAILSRLGDVANDELRRDLFAALRAPVAAAAGEEVKTQGDGMMAVFPSADDAVAGAVEMQLAVARLDAREDVPKLIAMDVSPCADLSESPPLRLRVPPHQVSDERVSRLKDVLVAFPGDSQVQLHMGDKVVRLPDSWSVQVDSGLVSELRVIFGADCILSESA